MSKKKMICPKCGAELDEDSEVCFICHHKIEKSQDKNIEGDKRANYSTKETDEKREEKDNKKTDNDDKNRKPQPENSVNDNVTEKNKLLEDTQRDSSVTSKEKKKTKKIIFIPTIVVSVVLLFIAGVFFFSKMRTISNKPQTISCVASYDSEGNAYFVTEEKGLIKIKGEFEDGLSSNSQKTFVLIDKDGVLYKSAGGDSDLVKIDDNAYEICKVTDRGCIYAVSVNNQTTIKDVLEDLINKYFESDAEDVSYSEVENIFKENYDYTVEDAKQMYEDVFDEEYDEKMEYNYYVYYYESGNKIDLGNLNDMIFAEDNLSNACFNEDGNLYLYDDNTLTFNKVASSNKNSTINIKGINSDGTQVVYIIEKDEKNDVYVADINTSEKIGTFESGNISTEYNKDGSSLVVVAEEEGILIKNHDKEVVNIKLDSASVSGSIYDESGMVISNHVGDINKIFIYGKTDDSTCVYSINIEGNKEKIISNLYNVGDSFSMISKSRIIYIDEDSDLYIADLKDNSTENEMKISSDVGGFKLSKDKKIVLFTKDDSLYYCMINNKDPESTKISSEIGEDIYISTNGKYVYYYKDRNYIADSYYEIGELYRYKIGGDSEKITSDVYKVSEMYSVYDECPSLDSNNIYIYKFNDYNEEDHEIELDIGKLNGTEFKKIYSGIRG